MKAERLMHFERALRALRRRGLNFDVHLMDTSHLTLSQNKLRAGRDGQMKPCESFEAFSLIVPKMIQSLTDRPYQ